MTAPDERDDTQDDARDADNSRDDDRGARDDPHDGTDQGISDDQLPEDLQPGPDNPLATPDGSISEAPKPQASDDPDR